MNIKEVLCNSSVKFSVNPKVFQNKKAKATKQQRFKGGTRKESLGGTQNSAVK